MPARQAALIHIERQWEGTAIATGRDGLAWALDLMEELRPVLADRRARSLLNRRQLRARDFKTRDGGAVLLSDDGRRTVLMAWQEPKEEERRHPFLDEAAQDGEAARLERGRRLLRGAWIETSTPRRCSATPPVASFAGAWIETSTRCSAAS